MRADINNIFCEIYKLQKIGKSEKALSILFNKETGRIRSPYNEDLNHAWYTIGDIFYQNKEYKKAIKAFKNSIRNYPKDIEALWAIANCYSELGKPWISCYYLEKAITFEKNIGSLRYNLGNALFDMGKYYEAIEQYKSVNKDDKQLRKLAHSNIHKAKKLIFETIRLTV